MLNSNTYSKQFEHFIAFESLISIHKVLSSLNTIVLALSYTLPKLLKSFLEIGRIEINEYVIYIHKNINKINTALIFNI